MQRLEMLIVGQRVERPNWSYGEELQRRLFGERISKPWYAQAELTERQKEIGSNKEEERRCRKLFFGHLQRDLFGCLNSMYPSMISSP